MPDNMNNNSGNNITNGYQNTSDDSMTYVDLTNSLNILSASIIKLDEHVKSLTTVTNDSNKTNKDIYKSLSSKDSNSLLTSISNLKKLMEKYNGKGNVGNTNYYEKAIKDIVNERSNLTTKLNEIKTAQQNTNNQKELKALFNTEKGIKDSLDKLDKAENSIEKVIKEELSKAEKLAQHRQKVNEARDWKIANNLESCFEGGLADLGKNLTNTFKESTNNNIVAMQRGVVGNLIAFAERSLVSAIDFQTKEYIKGIDTLQSTFESVGTNITKSILIDRDEVARSWQDVADRLKADNLAKTVSLTDVAQYQETAAKAGITNADLLESIGYAAAKTSALSGTAMADITSTENLGLLNSIYTQAVKSGQKDEEARALVEDVILRIGEQASGVIGEAGSAIGLSEGKLNDLVTEYLKIYASKGTGTLAEREAQAGTFLSGSLAAQGIMGTTSGGQSIYQNFASYINSLSNEALASGDTNSIAGILGGYVDEKSISEARKSGNYVSIFTKMIENIDQIVGAAEESNAISQAKLLKDVFGLDRDEYNQMMSSYGGAAGLIEAMKVAQEQAQLGTESSEYQRRMGLLTSGKTVTVEQGLKNRAVVDAAKAWGLAEESGIPYATEILKDTINTSTSLLESVITGGVSTIYNALVGNTAGSLLGSLGGIGKCLGIGGAAIGIGLALKTYLDLATEFMEVAPTQDAIDNLKKIEEENEAKNTEWRTKTLSALTNNNELLSQNKDVVKDILKGITDTDDAKVNVGRTFKQKLEQGETYDINVDEFKKGFKQETGVDWNSASDTQIADYYLKNQAGIDSRVRSNETAKSNYQDIQQAAGNYKITKGMSAFEGASNLLDVINTNGGLLDASETALLKTNISNILNEKDWTAEEKESYIKDSLEAISQYNADYNRYYGAMRVMNEALAAYNNYDTSGLSPQAAEAAKLALLIAYKRGELGLDSTRAWATYSGVSDYFDFDKTNLTNGLTLKNANEIAMNRYKPENVNKFAVGIDYVPYDNFPALLHKGERVITAADARIEDLQNNVARYAEYSGNNNNASNNYSNELSTTNNSIESGFNTTTANQEVIIEALKTIVSALLNSNGNNNSIIFDMLNTDKVALRTNNMGATASLHY